MQHTALFPHVSRIVMQKQSAVAGPRSLELRALSMFVAINMVIVE